MGIRQKGYTGWDGEVTRAGMRWLPILRNGIRRVAKQKYAGLVFFLATTPFLFFLAVIYAVAKPELRMFSRLVRSLQSDASLFQMFYTNNFLIFILVVLCIFSGAGLVSGDLRLRALPLYFSRPLSRTGYLAGKLSIVLFYLLLFTLIPGMILFFLKMVFTGSMILKPDLWLAMVAFPLLVGLFLAAMTLFLSTLSERLNFVRIILVAVFFFSDAVAAILAEITHMDGWRLLSVNRNINHTGAFFFGQEGEFAVSPVYSAVILAAAALLAILFLYLRIRRAEATA